MTSEQHEAAGEDTVDLSRYRRTQNREPRAAFTRRELRAILDGDAPAPHGIDPETIAAVRRIAAMLRGECDPP
jgi:hypothetical protein